MLSNNYFEKIGRVYAQGVIKFDDDSAICDEHDSDCCEWVYANFESVKNDAIAMAYDFDHIEFQQAEGGFRFGDGKVWVYVPCYNIQNGYYSDDLDVYYFRKVRCFDVLTATLSVEDKRCEED